MFGNPKRFAKSNESRPAAGGNNAVDGGAGDGRKSANGKEVFSAKHPLALGSGESQPLQPVGLISGPAPISVAEQLQAILGSSSSGEAVRILSCCMRILWKLVQDGAEPTPS